MEGKKERQKVLIMVTGEIFSCGLQIHCQEWGFEPLVVSWQSPVEVPLLIQVHRPSLLIMDIITWSAGPDSEELLCYGPLPIIFLVNHLLINSNPHQVLPRAKSYQLLPKPCSVSELKKAVERLLSIAILTNVPVE